MIRAIKLSHRYGATVALDEVSFEARPGEVLGLLGPNGAGKTTAMRIVTGYLAPSAGEVEVCGRPFEGDPVAARARVGYLPESVPIYPEMRVGEYLAYRAELKGVPRRERAGRIAEALGQVGLEGEGRRIVGQLSKGYRQRVGLADTLVHQPAVLILDEPTDGLDPNQRREILALVAALGRERAVVLSSHVLPEVESVCGRVVILDRGRVVAEGRPAELATRTGGLEVVARGERARLEAALARVPGVRAVRAEVAVPGGDVQAFVVEVAGEAEGDVAEAVAEAVSAVGRLRELRPRARALDEVFAAITGGRPGGGAA